MKKNPDIVSQIQNDPYSQFQDSGVVMSQIIEEVVDFKLEDFLPPEIQSTGFPITNHSIFLGKVNDGDDREVNEQNERKKIELDEGEMHEIERQKFEKIKWQLPSSASEESENKSTRFDFDGNIITSEDELSQNFPNEYYHHGKEPSRPGYNLEEILMLIRSENASQRLLFLELFSKVLKVQQKRNYKFYDVHIVPLFEKLKLFDLFQLIGRKNKKNHRISSLLSDIYHTLFQADQFLHFSRLHLQYSETKTVPYISPLPQDPGLHRHMKKILEEILDRRTSSSSSSLLFSSLHSFLKIKEFEVLMKKNPEECINALYLHFTQNNGYSSLPRSFHEKVCAIILEVINEKKPVPVHCGNFFHGLVQYYTQPEQQEKKSGGKLKSLNTSHRGLLKFSVSQVHEYVEKFPSALGFLNFYLPGKTHVIFDIITKFIASHIDMEEPKFNDSYLGTVCELLFPIITSKEYLKDRDREKHPVKKLLSILRPRILRIFMLASEEKSIISNWKNWLNRTFSKERLGWWKYNSNKGSPNMILSLVDNDEDLGMKKIEEFYSDVFQLHQILRFCWADRLFAGDALPHEEMIWEACTSLFLVGGLGSQSLVTEVYVNRYRKFTVLPLSDCLRFLVKSARLFRKKKKNKKVSKRICWNEGIEKLLEFYLLYMSTQPRLEKHDKTLSLDLSTLKFEEEEEGESDDDDDDELGNEDLMNHCFLKCVKNSEVRKRLKEVLLSRNFGVLQGDWFLFVIEEFYRNQNDQGGAARIWSPTLIHPTLVCLNELENFHLFKTESSESLNNYVDQVIPFHIRYMNLLKLLLERNGLKMYQSPSIREEMLKYVEHYFRNYFSHPVLIFQNNNTNNNNNKEEEMKLRNEDEESMFIEFVDMILQEYQSVSFRDGLFSTFILILLGKQWSVRIRSKILNDLKRCLFLYFHNIEKRHQDLFFEKNCSSVELEDSKDHFELAKIIVEDYLDCEESCLECKNENLFMYNVLKEMLRDFLKVSKNYRFFIIRKLNPMLKSELNDVL